MSGVVDQALDLGPHILVGGELVLVFRAGDLDSIFRISARREVNSRLASGIRPGFEGTFLVSQNAVAFVIFKEILPVVFMLAI